MSTLTVGTISEKVTDAGVAVDGVTLKDGGAVFTSDVTIGDASASDKKILFDGNAQDFHIGLDDSNDSLTIGLGSALGTTSHMVIDANGHITKPLQSAFHVGGLSSTMENLSLATDHTIVFDTERFDQNSDYNTSTGEFTAPVTGRYFFTSHMYVQNIDTGATYFQIKLNTSNKTYIRIIEPKFSADVTYYNFSISSVLVDMDAGDTAKVQLRQTGGTAQLDVNNATAYTVFTGYLVA